MSVMSKSITLSSLPKSTILKQSVGLDVSKAKVQACFSQCQLDKPFRVISSHSYECSESGFEKLAEWIEKHRKADVALHFLMEATGVYYENLAYFLKSKGYRVTVLLAKQSQILCKEFR